MGIQIYQPTLASLTETEVEPTAASLNEQVLSSALVEDLKVLFPNLRLDTGKLILHPSIHLSVDKDAPVQLTGEQLTIPCIDNLSQLDKKSLWQILAPLSEA